MVYTHEELDPLTGKYKKYFDLITVSRDPVKYPIERLIGLAHVNFGITDLVNPQGISGLHNLKSLSMTLTDENPSI